MYRTIFSDDFIGEIDYQTRFSALKQLSQKKTVLSYLRNRYTRIYRSALFDRNTNSTEYQKGVFAGRVIELLALLNEIENAAQITQDEFQERLERTRKRQEMLTKDNEMFSFGDHLIKKVY